MDTQLLVYVVVYGLISVFLMRLGIFLTQQLRRKKQPFLAGFTLIIFSAAAVGLMYNLDRFLPFP